MLPNMEERLDSVIRALSTIVLDSLPDNATLAREQVQVSIGHISILRDQIDMLAPFGKEELEDAMGLAALLLQQCDGGPLTQSAKTGLMEEMARMTASLPSQPAVAKIYSAINIMIEAAFADGTDNFRKSLNLSVIEFEIARANKDRQIFKPYGFDG